jgi:hypothetical protein
VNFKGAKNKSIRSRVLGAAIIGPAIISSSVSFLKIIYYRLDDGTRLGSIIAQPFKDLTSWVYQNTPYLNFFWENSPVPDHLNLSNMQNFYFLAIYLLVFIGFAFYASGTKLSSRLATINEKIENQLIEESIKGAGARSREDIERSTEIASNSIFSQIHQLYLAPVVTGVVGAALIKILGV